MKRVNRPKSRGAMPRGASGRRLRRGPECGQVQQREERQMARIGFVGFGNMGGPMARNLLKAGHQVAGYDLVPAALEAFAAAGGTPAASAAAAATGAEFVITMLPAGRHVRDAWLGAGGMAVASAPAAILIDCSTIDVDTARAVAAQAGRPMLDAPVSGGTMGAEAGSLTFMVG